MADTLDVQVAQALTLLPETGEVEFDAYKARIQEQNPENWKPVLQRMMISQSFNKRLQTNSGAKPTLLVSRKVG